MAFFLETLIGGLMAGMLYSLVALGFVLIYKASGVFNFAQGAMVLFAALAMARFAEWIPQWTGIDNAIVANVAAFTQTPEHRRYPRVLQVVGAVGCVILVATLPLPSIVGGVVVLAIGVAYRAARLLALKRR